LRSESSPRINSKSVSVRRIQSDGVIFIKESAIYTAGTGQNSKTVNDRGRYRKVV
jgi:hypothetical protein